MDYCELVKSTVLPMDEEIFRSFRSMLVGEYITFSVLSGEEITRAALAEKLCDYFEKLEMKTSKAFDRHLDEYLDDLEKIVEPYVNVAPALALPNPLQPKKDAPEEPPSRAKKYFDKAEKLKNIRSLTVTQLQDYSRIMLCLYAAILRSEHKHITNFDFAASSLQPEEIIDAMKSEQTEILKFRKKLFDIKELYCSDTCTLILTVLMLWKIRDDQVRGGKQG